MALFLKDPCGRKVWLKHIDSCNEPAQVEYLCALLKHAGVSDFYSTTRALRPAGSRLKKMPYDKLASHWRRYGRRYCSRHRSLTIRVWDCRKLVDIRPKERVGVLAVLFEVITASGQKSYCGYYGLLSDLAKIQ